MVVIGLHVVPVLQEMQGQLQTTWPIMAWGMYKNSRPAERVKSVQLNLVGVTSTGGRRDIHAWQSGLSSYAFKRLYLRPMMQGDLEAAQRLGNHLNARFDEQIVAFRLESETYTLMDTGLVKTHNRPIVITLATKTDEQEIER